MLKCLILIVVLLAGLRETVTGDDGCWFVLTKLSAAQHPRQLAKYSAVPRWRGKINYINNSMVVYLNKSLFSFLRQLTTWHCRHLLLRAVRQYRSIASGRRAHGSKPARSGVRGGQMGQTDRQRDGRTPDSCIDPAPHTMRTASKNKNTLSKTFSVLARPIRYQNFNTQTNN